MLHPSRRARSLSRRKFNRGFERENRGRAQKRNYRSSLQRSGDPKIFGNRLPKKSCLIISNYLFAGSGAPRRWGTRPRPCALADGDWLLTGRRGLLLLLRIFFCARPNETPWLRFYRLAEFLKVLTDRAKV